MRVHADAADAAEPEEREDEVVVARVEVEARARRSRRAWSRSSWACLTAVTVGISASSAIVSGSMLITTRLGML